MKKQRKTVVQCALWSDCQFQESILHYFVKTIPFAKVPLLVTNGTHNDVQMPKILNTD